VKLVRSFLTLREGSIVVVTLVTFAYFAISANNFVQGNTFKSLLPYFAPLAIIAAVVAWLIALAAAGRTDAPPQVPQDAPAAPGVPR